MKLNNLVIELLVPFAAFFETYSAFVEFVRTIVGLNISPKILAAFYAAIFLYTITVIANNKLVEAYEATSDRSQQYHLLKEQRVLKFFYTFGLSYLHDLIIKMAANKYGVGNLSLVKRSGPSSSRSYLYKNSPIMRFTEGSDWKELRFVKNKKGIVAVRKANMDGAYGPYKEESILNNKFMFFACPFKSLKHYLLG